MVEIFAEKLKRKIANENDRCGREWEIFPQWEMMTREERERAISLAEVQGRRTRSILDSYSRDTNG